MAKDSAIELIPMDGDKLANWLLSGDIYPCEQCGCLGNEMCGHEPYDPKWDCSLKWDLRCACCHVRDN